MTFVSVITSTFDRLRFIPRLIEMYVNQTWPKDQMEWIILDDGAPGAETLFKNASAPNIRYISLDKKRMMGEKLNLIKKEARGDIIVVFDDDDYYPPSRVEHVVQAFNDNPTYEVAGASEVFMYFTDTNKIYRTGPYSSTHALNCTMAFRKSYAETHDYDDKEPCAVESSFLRGFSVPMIQLDTRKTLLHIIHSTNTFNAIKARNQSRIGLMRLTTLQLEDFIKDDRMCAAFYNVY
jgi:glycosyltransferase involved in cell wall biosynthesis